MSVRRVSTRKTKSPYKTCQQPIVAATKKRKVKRAEEEEQEEEHVEEALAAKKRSRAVAVRTPVDVREPLCLPKSPVLLFAFGFLLKSGSEADCAAAATTSSRCSSHSSRGEVLARCVLSR